MPLTGHRVEAALHRYRYAFLTAYSLLLLTLLSLIAARRLFWYDESFTMLIASLPDAGAIWNALARGAENQPPLNFWLVHASLPASGPLELFARIPAIGSYWLMTLCLYRIVERESSATWGFIAMLIPFQSTLYFAYEARPYAPLLLFAAASVLGWQLIKSGARRSWGLVLFFLALTASVYSHYYGALVFLPFIGTELALGVMRKRWDRPVWAAILLAGLASLPLAPTVIRVGGFSSMFFDPAPIVVAVFYLHLFGVPGAVFGLVTVAAGLMGPSAPSPALQGGAKAVLASRAGTLLLLLFCLLPVAGFVLAEWVTKAYSDRYFVFALVGFSTGLALMLHRRWRNQPWLALSCLVIFGGVAVLEVARHYTTPGYRAGNSVDVAEAIRVVHQVPDDQEPVLVSGFFYLPIRYYSSPGFRQRLYLLDEDPRHFTVAARRLEVVIPMPIVPLDDVFRKFPRFYVYRPSYPLMARIRALSMEVSSVENDLFHVVPPQHFLAEPAADRR